MQPYIMDMDIATIATVLSSRLMFGECTISVDAKYKHFETMNSSLHAILTEKAEFSCCKIRSLETGGVIGVKEELQAWI